MLVPVDARNRGRVLELAPYPNQRKYSGVPLDTLPMAERDPAQRPFAILAEGEPVGFFVLHGGAGASRYVRPPHELLLRAFFVAAAWQGQGIGRQALAALPALVRDLDPDATRIALTVNTDNVPAIRAYLQAGFADTGEVTPGVHGPQHVFALDLPPRR